MKNLIVIVLSIFILICGFIIGHFMVQSQLSMWFIMTYNDLRSKEFYINQEGLGNEVINIIEDILPKLLKDGCYQLAGRKDLPKRIFSPVIFKTEDELQSIMKNSYLFMLKVIYRNENGLIKLSHQETKQFLPGDFPLLVNRYIVEQYGKINDHSVRIYVFSNGKGFIDSKTRNYYQYQNNQWCMMTPNFKITKVRYPSIKAIVGK